MLRSIIYGLLLAVVSSFMLSCREDVKEEPIPESKIHSIAIEIDSRLHSFDGAASDATTWYKGDLVKLAENERWFGIAEQVDDDTSSHMKYMLSVPKSDDLPSYRYVALYPSMLLLDVKSDAGLLEVHMPYQQQPSHNGYDYMSDPLISNTITTDNQPVELYMQFERMGACVEIKTKGLPEDGTISTLIFEIDKPVLAGCNSYDVQQGRVVEYGVKEGSSRVELSYEEPIATDNSLYMICNPVTLRSGESYSVKVVCDGVAYTTQTTIPQGEELCFAQGVVSELLVDFGQKDDDSGKGEEPVEFIEFGSERYAVVARDGSDYYAMCALTYSNEERAMLATKVDYQGGNISLTSNYAELLGWYIVADEPYHNLRNSDGEYLSWSVGNSAELSDKACSLSIRSTADDQRYTIHLAEDDDYRLVEGSFNDINSFIFSSKEGIDEMFIIPIDVKDEIEEDVELSLSVETLDFDVKGGSQNIMVTATGTSASVDVEILGAESKWLTVTEIGGGSYEVKADINDCGEQRSAELRFTLAESSASLAVTQSFDYLFKRVNVPTSGRGYLIASDRVVAQPVAADRNSDYLDGRSYSCDADGYIVTRDLSELFVFEAGAGGYAISQLSDGRYLYQIGCNNSLGAEKLPVSGYIWDVYSDNGTLRITNRTVDKHLQYVSGSFGSYNHSLGEQPILYELCNAVVSCGDMPAAMFEELQLLAEGDYVVAVGDRMMLAGEGECRSSALLSQERDTEGRIVVNADALWHLYYDNSAKSYALYSAEYDSYLGWAVDKAPLAETASPLHIVKGDEEGCYNLRTDMSRDYQLQYNRLNSTYAFYNTIYDDNVRLLPAVSRDEENVEPEPEPEPEPMPMPTLTNLEVSLSECLAWAGCVVTEPHNIEDGMVEFTFRATDDSHTTKGSYYVGTIETYAYVEDVKLNASTTYEVTAACMGVDGVVVYSNTKSVTTPAVEPEERASEEWLEMPAIRNDGAYPNAAEYKLYVGNERNYTTYYDTSTYTSMWVAYPISSKHMGSYGRPDNWSFNPLISTSDQVNLCSHSYSGNYSRGHLIPNAARNGIRDMQLQTFYVTNSVPQIQDNFNGGIWMYLEGALQDIAESETIYIVTGVAFEKEGESRSISYTKARDDDKQVPVPNYFYKVALKVKQSGGKVTSASTVGFWFEHKAYTDTYSNYAVSVDQIEEWTGFNFFVNLPDDIERSAEQNASWSAFRSF